MKKESETLTRMKELLPGVFELRFETLCGCCNEGCCDVNLCDDCIEIGDYAKQKMKLKFQEVVVNATVNEIKRLFEFMQTDFMKDDDVEYDNCRFYIDSGYDSLRNYCDNFVEYIIHIEESLNSKQLTEFFKQFLVFNDISINKNILSYLKKNKEKMHCKNLQNLIATHIVLDV